MYHWPPLWLGISCMTTDNFCFYLQNRLIQTSQTGGQWYSDASPFSIPWSNSILTLSQSGPFNLICFKVILKVGSSGLNGRTEIIFFSIGLMQFNKITDSTAHWRHYVIDEPDIWTRFLEIRWGGSMSRALMSRVYMSRVINVTRHTNDVYVALSKFRALI